MLRYSSTRRVRDRGIRIKFNLTLYSISIKMNTPRYIIKIIARETLGTNAFLKYARTVHIVVVNCCETTGIIISISIPAFKLI